MLLKKSLKSGRVKIKIAKVTTNTTTRLHAMMDIYGLNWGSTGLKYIHTYIPPLFPLRKQEKYKAKKPALRDIQNTVGHKCPSWRVVV